MPIVHDPNLLRLGKLPVKIDHLGRTLLFSKYAAGLPPPPLAVDWSPGAGQLTMMGNDVHGDCVAAGVGHIIQVDTGNANPPAKVLSDDEVLALYRQSGWNPADPSTDRGWFLLDALNFWRQTGVGNAADKIVAFAAINPKNTVEMQQAIALFGAIYCGVALPISAQSQGTWDTTPTSPGDMGSWGGHCVPLSGYYPASAQGWWDRLLGIGQEKPGAICITWGATKRLTWDFVTAYMDEAYAIVTQDWIEANGKSPSGFDLAGLQADLAEVTA